MALSKRLNKCSGFVKFLLTHDKIQSEAVLVTATNLQVNCISEIFRNILRLPILKRTRSLISKLGKAFHVIAKKLAGIKTKRQLIQKFAKLIVDILFSVKKRLLSLYNTT